MVGRKAHYTNVLEKAIHFWRSSAGWVAALKKLNYNGNEEVPMTHMWWTNVMNKSSHVPQKENVAIEKKG